MHIFLETEALKWQCLNQLFDDQLAAGLTETLTLNKNGKKIRQLGLVCMRGNLNVHSAFSKVLPSVMPKLKIRARRLAYLSFKSNAGLNHTSVALILGSIFVHAN